MLTRGQTISEGALESIQNYEWMWPGTKKRDDVDDAEHCLNCGCKLTDSEEYCDGCWSAKIER